MLVQVHVLTHFSAFTTQAPLAAESPAGSCQTQAAAGEQLHLSPLLHSRDLELDSKGRLTPGGGMLGGGMPGLMPGGIMPGGMPGLGGPPGKPGGRHACSQRSPQYALPASSCCTGMRPRAVQILLAGSLHASAGCTTGLRARSQLCARAGSDFGPESQWCTPGLTPGCPGGAKLGVGPDGGGLSTGAPCICTQRLVRKVQRSGSRFRNESSCQVAIGNAAQSCRHAAV